MAASRISNDIRKRNGSWRGNGVAKMASINGQYQRNAKPSMAKINDQNQSASGERENNDGSEKKLYQWPISIIVAAIYWRNGQQWLV